jgi:hypothetical protein
VRPHSGSSERWLSPCQSTKKQKEDEEETDEKHKGNDEGRENGDLLIFVSAARAAAAVCS